MSGGDVKVINGDWPSSWQQPGRRWSSSKGYSLGPPNQKPCVFGKASTLELQASNFSADIEEVTAYTV